MINMDANSRLAKWFVWSCDHLLLTVTHIYDDGKDCGRRKGASYIANGTTLCHIVWATLWVPIATVAVFSVIVFLFVTMHIVLHQDIMAAYPDAGPLLFFASYFAVEGMAIAIAAIAGVLILSLIGGSKVGFFKLLWLYLKSIKQRVCPLVHFDGARIKASE